MFEHNKRPLYAFFVVAAICGIVIGTTIRSQAILGLVAPWAGPSSIVAGHVFAPAPAAADEPSAADAAAKKVHHNAPRNGLDAPPVGHRAVPEKSTGQHKSGAKHHNDAKHRTDQVKHQVKHQQADSGPGQPEPDAGENQSGHHSGPRTDDGDQDATHGLSVDVETNGEIIPDGQPAHPGVSPGLVTPGLVQPSSVASGASGQSLSVQTPLGSVSVSLTGLSR